MAMDGAFKVDTSKKFTFKLLVRHDDEISKVVAKLRNAGFDKVRVVNNQSEGIVDLRNPYNIEVDEISNSIKEAFLIRDKILTISDRKIINDEIQVG